jgi:transcription initiation factor TFIID TATA-box-binding protein
MRLREPKATALIFQSGKIIVTGAKSTDAALLAARKFTVIMKKIGYHVSDASASFKLQNVLGSADVGFPIKLGGLAMEHNLFATCGFFAFFSSSIG